MNGMKFPGDGLVVLIETYYLAADKKSGKIIRI